MKKIIIIILFASAINVYSQQTTIVHYRFSFEEFTEKPKNKAQQHARLMVKKIAEYSKEHNYILKTKDNESLYYVEPAVPIDGIQDQFAYKFSTQNISKGIFYMNLKTNEVLNQKETMGKTYLVKSKVNYKWKTTGETKNILGYKCYKAIQVCDRCNEKQAIVAWFALDIPIRFGPAGYGGLPGLILELKKYRYTLTADEIKFNKQVKITKPSKGIVISEEELKVKQAEIRNRMKEKHR